MTPAEIVGAYLAVHMNPDAFSARRYKWVKKRFERTETVAGGDAEPASQMHPGGKR